MKKFFPLSGLFLFGLFAAPLGCGGPSTTVVNASVAVPFELLSIASYQTQLTLNDSGTGAVVQGPVTLTKDDTNDTWVAEMKGIDKRDYQAVVEIIVIDAGEPLVLARAERDVPVNKDAPYATLTFKPSDFDTSMDDDGDGVTNVEEVIYSLNPWDADTNHDGVPDLDEVTAMKGGAA